MIADERFYPKELDMDSGPFIRHFDRYFQCVKTLGKIGKQQRWLDCACGSGYGSRILSNFSSNIVGYDISSDAIDYAILNYGNESCTFKNEFSELDPDFDVIFSVETIEHMPESDAHQFLSRLNKVLKNNGHMVITTPIVKSTNRNPINKFHYIEYSHDDFIDLLQESGFYVESYEFIETTFTDGETKDQGYYKCHK